MPCVTVTTLIHASAERCFDAARDLDLHVASMSGTEERAVGGRTSGLIELGEHVTWEARHFGIRQRLTSEITLFDRPRHFQDSMTKGAFRSFVHDHFFEPVPRGTLMLDVLVFRSPLGVLGAVVDHLVMARYLMRLLSRRALVLKTAIESAV